MTKLESFFGKFVAQQCFELISNAIKDQGDETDWDNTRICLVDGKKSFHVVSGTAIHNWIVYTEDGTIDIVKSFWKQYLDEFVSVEVITKRVLGRLIIKYIGNEGSDIDARKTGLRTLFQTTIDYIQTHDIANIWENATVTVYDSDDNVFKISSGNGKNHFMVIEYKGKPTVIYTVNNQMKELNGSEDESLLKKCYNRLFCYSFCNTS
ncbi:unnamed protein product [Mytilus coruscus]|uniref:Uncharacterized protein n=1 Tax=Mytilus coruscus TaxID=42192 RepID=A0A6J8D8R5_MYTCO|nr:unnamed protein product [Mytilus coruscus]